MINFNEVVNNMTLPKKMKEELKNKIKTNLDSLKKKSGVDVDKINPKHKMIIVQTACEKLVEKYHKSLIAERHELEYEVVEYVDSGINYGMSSGLKYLSARLTCYDVVFHYGVYTYKFKYGALITMIDAWLEKDGEISGEELVDKMEGFMSGAVNRWFDEKYKMKMELKKIVSSAGAEMVEESGK